MGEITDCTAAGSKSFQVRDQNHESAEADQQIQRQAQALSNITKQQSTSERMLECSK